MHKNTLNAANDNSGGTTTIDTVLMGLVDLFARVKAKRRCNEMVAGTLESGVPATLPHAPKKGNAK